MSDLNAWWTNRRHDSDEVPLPGLELPGDPSWLEPDSESAWTVSNDPPASTAENDNPTIEIPGLIEGVNPEPEEEFFIPPLTRQEFDQLSPEEQMTMRKRVTILASADAVRDRRLKKSKPPKPAEYHSRYYVWKLVVRLMAVGLVAIAWWIIVWALTSSGVMSGESSALLITWSVLGMAIPAYAAAWFSLDWHDTELFSTLSKTGIKRQRRAWFYQEIDKHVETSRLQAKDATRLWIVSQLRINSWRVTLDAPAEKDNFLEKLRWVRNGRDLVNTVVKVQEFHQAG